MFKFSLAEWSYGVVLLVAGIVLGILSPRYPAFFDQVPTLVVLLAIGLIADLCINFAAMRGVTTPLTMQSRFVAFMIGAIVMLLLASSLAKTA